MPETDRVCRIAIIGTAFGAGDFPGEIQQVNDTDDLDDFMQQREQLEQGAKAFINDPTKNQFDRQRKTAHLSMIFKWFEEDFVTHSGSLTRYVKRYVTESELARDLETTPYSVQFEEYDWRLNGLPPAQERHARFP